MILFVFTGGDFCEGRGKVRDDWIGEGALERGCEGEVGWVI